MTREIKQRRTIEEKLAEMNGQEIAQISEQKELKSEVLKSDLITHISAKEVEKNYTFKTVGVRVDIKKDLNREIDLLCIDLEENKKDLLAQWISEGVAKARRKLEK